MACSETTDVCLVSSINLSIQSCVYVILYVWNFYTAQNIATYQWVCTEVRTKHLIQELFQITSYIQFCIVWDDMRHDVCVLPVYVYVVSCINAVTLVMCV